VSLEKVFEVEIDGKDYEIEMTNMAFLEFERAVGMSVVDWAIDALNAEGQPQYEDMLSLLIAALKKHNKTMKHTVETLQHFVSPFELFLSHGTRDTTGDRLIQCLTAAFPDNEDVNQSGGTSVESDEGPLVENPPDGGT
jgi:hypothetical protein